MSSSAGFSSFSSTVITSASRWWTPRRRRAASVHLSPAGIKSRCQPESVWVILLLRHTLPAASINCGNTWLKLSISGEHLVTKTMNTRTNAGVFTDCLNSKCLSAGHRQHSRHRPATLKWINFKNMQGKWALQAHQWRALIEQRTSQRVHPCH